MASLSFRRHYQQTDLFYERVALDAMATPIFRLFVVYNTRIPS
jgi:hypothetical protein